MTAMQALARASAAQPTDPSVTAALTSCDDVDDWLAALKKHPKAMGLTEKATVGDLEVQIVCHPAVNRSHPVCADAVAKGIVK